MWFIKILPFAVGFEGVIFFTIAAASTQSISKENNEESDSGSRMPSPKITPPVSTKENESRWN